MLEDELLKIAKKLNNKKTKSKFNEQVEIFDSIKGALGMENIERQKIPMEFDNIEDFEKFVKDYINKYSDDIARYSNRVLMLNERIKVSKSEDDILELYSILNGFAPFLMINSLNLTEK